MQGRVKFHRKITEREWYSDANTFRVFFHLITTANHKDGKWQGIDIKRGQTITGRKELAKKLNLSEMQIRTSLDKLERTGEISKKITNRFTIVTVLKYCDYNDYDLEDNQQITNKQPTDNQQITTNNNDKNKKEGKENIKPSKNFFDNVDDYYNNLIEGGYIDKRMPNVDHEWIKQRIEDMLIIITGSKGKYKLPEMPKTHFQDWNKNKQTGELIYKKRRIQLSDDKIRK